MPYVSKPSFQKMLAKCLNIAVLSQLLTSLVAQMVKCLHTMQETHVQSLGWEDLLEKEMATHSSILAWKIPWMEEPGRLHTVHGGRKEPDTTERIHLSRERASDV